MRALAVLSVLIYHLWPNRLSGGFVGVDAFFVISGFLITNLLVREAELTGRIRLWRFWSRRVRRLLPAAFATLIASAVAIYVVVPTNLWPQFLRETIAATLYVQNWVLAGDAVDYLAANNVASPAQHFWTLSVEEQFYVVVPILLIGLLAVGRHIRVHPRRMILGGLVIVTVLSFAYSVWVTSLSAPTAYFSTATRMWEFGIGALLVFAPPLRGRRLSTGVALAGLGLLVIAVTTLSGDLPFPGYIAALPVLGAAAVIWAGRTATPTIDQLAGWSPIQFFGRISYSLYLWHWPIIVIVPYATGHELTTLDKVAVIVASIGIAWASTSFIEVPMRMARHDPRWRSLLITNAVSASATVIIVAIAGTGLIVGERNRVEALRVAEMVLADDGDCLGAMSVVNLNSCAGVVADDVLVPDPAQAASDDWNLPECWSGLEDTRVNWCEFGPVSSETQLIAIGDSHNNVLLSAYKRMAEENDWRIAVAGHNGCYWSSAVHEKPTEALVDACEAWKVGLSSFLNGRDPYDAILVTNARDRYPVRISDGDNAHDVLTQGFVDSWAQQIDRGARIIAIRDNPGARSDIVTCVATHLAAANEQCSSPRKDALGARDPLVDAVSVSPGARLIDLTDLYCDESECNVIIGNVVVYRDKDHLTATFSKTLAPILSDAVIENLP